MTDSDLISIVAIIISIIAITISILTMMKFNDYLFEKREKLISGEKNIKDKKSKIKENGKLKGLFIYINDLIKNNTPAFAILIGIVILIIIWIFCPSYRFWE